MRTAKVTNFWVLMALAFGLAAMAGAQTPSGGPAQVMLSSGGLVPGLGQSGQQGEILREIDDLHTGDRWLLMRNDQNPGGPGRMVLVTADRRPIAMSAQQGAGQVGAGHTEAGHAEEAVAPPIIRSGDRLIIEKHTAVVDAVLEARAVTPAALGATFDVRLTIGGKVVRAVALGSGRAAFQTLTGARP
jgi:hypothetical protein